MEDPVELRTLIEHVDDYLDATTDARQQSERCRDYYDGNQYTSEEIEILQQRRQPIVVNNRVQPMVDFLVGMEIASRTDPKAFARTPKHELEADSVTDAVRYVEDKERFDTTSTDVFEEFLVEGLSGVACEWDKQKKEVKLTHVHYNRMILDPHARSKQITDDRYRGVVTWMDLHEVENRWGKDKSIEVTEGMQNAIARSGDTFDDMPRWYDTKRRRVMVIELYFMHNEKWHRAVFTNGSMLEAVAVSPYKDQDGIPVCPFIFASPKVDRAGGRYGLVATRLSMQDSINKRQTKATDLLNRKQTWSKKGALEDVDEFKKQANDSGGHIEFPPMGKFGEDFGIIENEALAGPQFQMYQDDISQLEAIKNGGLADSNDSNLSGKAIRTLQQGRSLEVAPIREVYHQWLIRVATAIWERIRQFWKEETWIRVTDDEANVRFVGLNRNKTVRDLIIEQMGEIPQVVQQRPDLAARLDDEIRDENGKKVPMNKLAELDVDIFLEETPDVLTLQQEVFEKLAEMWQSNPERIPYETIIETSPLPAKMKQRLLQPPQQTPEQQQAAQFEQQTAQQTARLELVGKEAQVRKDMAEATESEQAAQQTAIENQLLALFAQAGGEPTQVNI